MRAPYAVSRDQPEGLAGECAISDQDSPPERATPCVRMPLSRAFRLIEIKKTTVSGCIMPAGRPGGATRPRPSEHHAKIRPQNAADRSRRPTRVEAERRRAARGSAADAGRDRAGRALYLVARSILSFREHGPRARVRHRRWRARWRPRQGKSSSAAPGRGDAASAFARRKPHGISCILTDRRCIH
jgi:hypothetical protein